MVIRKKPDQINRLSMAMQYRLIELTRLHYVESKFSDRDFAKYASEKLEFPVTPANVSATRDVFGLKSNRDVEREEKKAPQTRLAKIEERLEVLENFMRELTGTGK